ncbi:phosphoserine phosphatase SerB [Paraglaciecola hydrolytica]|uniref:Phosphoserine phosphatase n=1 Tax=Paraglaciecola hydrolytica TaxID=1799789 RepID=A0A136A045_9ALTE|nr:phosphoserine phosphatase SerB [Paraglaciecola hydrolytica]KXI28567.1 phosphoserine phosphatase [Paraglaciecola hydrolytica]
MFELSLSSTQLLSAHFLQDLVEHKHLNQFVLSQQTLSATEQTTSTEHKLLTFTEGLNLQQLLAVEQGLQDYLSIQYWQIVQVAGVAGFACAARVKLLTQNEIKTELELVANQLCLELCLLAQVPSLNEPGLLVMDMDSTVIACECIDDIATLAGVGAEVSAVTAQAMQGKLDFAQSLRTRVGCLTNADEAILQTVRNALPLMTGVTSLVRVLKQHNWKLAIASGGFTYFADYLAERLDLDAAVANKLEIVDGKLTGKVNGGIVDAQVKAQTLLALAEQWAIPHRQTIAMGDGANDLVMMAAASLGVALHAKPIVRQQADISIRRGGLDALLWVLAA